MVNSGPPLVRTRGPRHFERSAATFAATLLAVVTAVHHAPPLDVRGAGRTRQRLAIRRTSNIDSSLTYVKDMSPSIGAEVASADHRHLTDLL